MPVRCLPALILMLMAGAVFADEKPLRACYEQAETRLDVGPCLDAKLAAVQSDLETEVSRLKAEMKELAEVTGLLDPIVSFDGAQREFENYRAINCAWYYEMRSPGTGAGDAQKACMIRLTRTRVRELQAVFTHSDQTD